MNTMNQQKGSQGVGPTIALVIIILILLAGGLYFWLQNSTPTPTHETPATTQTTKTSDTSSMSNIQAELNATSDSDADQSLDTIDAQFEAQGSTQN